jgi:hypothetical protein
MRFVLMYFLLAIVAGSALGAFIVVLDRPHKQPPPPWSTFVPKGSLTARLFQIADTVPKSYRGASGRQLVGATVTPPQQQTSLDNGQSFVTLPVDRIEIYDHGNITTSPAAASIQFVLCGDGQTCELKSGQPSRARYRLLVREAFEMSLYAFKYVDGLDSITVLLPPSRTMNASGDTGQPRQTALFLRRKDVARQLSRPLSQTLETKAPKVGRISARDNKSLNQLALPHTYDWSIGQAQDGAWVRMLQPAS